MKIWTAFKEIKLNIKCQKSESDFQNSLFDNQRGFC